MEFVKGLVVRSAAGRDKGGLFTVVEGDGDYAVHFHYCEQAAFVAPRGGANDQPFDKLHTATSIRQG